MKQPDASQFHDLTFKSVLDALPCYLTIQDAHLNILFVNQTFMNDFGNGIGPKRSFFLKTIRSIR
jgi:hypothetical protein